jgi:hypothetical protein
MIRAATNQEIVKLERIVCIDQAPPTTGEMS